MKVTINSQRNNYDFKAEHDNYVFNGTFNTSDTNYDFWASVNINSSADASASADTVMDTNVGNISYNFPKNNNEDTMIHMNIDVKPAHFDAVALIVPTIKDAVLAQIEENNE